MVCVVCVCVMNVSYCHAHAAVAVPSKLVCTTILAEGAMTLPVTLSGGVLFAS